MLKVWSNYLKGWKYPLDLETLKLKCTELIAQHPVYSHQIVFKKIVKLNSISEEDKEEEKGDLVDQLFSSDSKPLKGTKKISSTKDELAPKKTAKARKNSTGKKKGSSKVEISEGFSDEVIELMPKIRSIFAYYCSYGDTGNKTKLKGSTFQKMLKAAKIIK